MQPTNEITVYLSLTSTDNQPEDVTIATGLQPTRFWRKGDPIVGTLRLHERNGWSLASGLDSSAELDEHLSALLVRLETAMPALKELSESWDVEVSCSIYSMTYVPPCHFERGAIQKLASIGAEIDVDFYCLQQ